MRVVFGWDTVEGVLAPFDGGSRWRDKRMCSSEQGCQPRSELRMFSCPSPLLFHLSLYRCSFSHPYGSSSNASCVFAEAEVKYYAA